MPSNLARMIVTTVIWMVCALVVVMSSMFGNVGEIGVVAPLIAATIGTLVVWTAGESSTGARPSHGAQQDYSKAKRDAGGDSRVQMLLELMSPEEREAFKDALKAQVMGDLRRGMQFDDGEIPASFASLLEDDDRTTRRR